MWKPRFSIRQLLPARKPKEPVAAITHNPDGPALNAEGLLLGVDGNGELLTLWGEEISNSLLWLGDNGPRSQQQYALLSRMASSGYRGIVLECGPQQDHLVDQLAQAAVGAGRRFDALLEPLQFEGDRVPYALRDSEVLFLGVSMADWVRPLYEYLHQMLWAGSQQGAEKQPFFLSIHNAGPGDLAGIAHLAQLMQKLGGTLLVGANDLPALSASCGTDLPDFLAQVFGVFYCRTDCDETRRHLQRQALSLWHAVPGRVLQSLDAGEACLTLRFGDQPGHSLHYLQAQA